MARKSINPGLPDLDRFLEGRERKFVTYAEGSDMYGIPYYSWLPGNGAGSRVQNREIESENPYEIVTKLVTKIEVVIIW